MRQATLRPGDVAVALELAMRPAERLVPLAKGIGISLGEAHNAVRRLRAARLLRPDTREVVMHALLDFVLSGVPYAFPAALGPETRGVPTAWSAPPLAEEFSEADPIVWASATDLAHLNSSSVTFRITPSEATGTGVPAITGTFAIHNNKAIKDVPDLGGEYQPRGNTPLYDALGKGIEVVLLELERVPQPRGAHGVEMEQFGGRVADLPRRLALGLVPVAAAELVQGRGFR